MQDFQDSFEIRKRSFISAFSIWMTVPLSTSHCWVRQLSGYRQIDRYLLYIYVYLFIYIYIYIHICKYVSIYIYNIYIYVHIDIDMYIDILETCEYLCRISTTNRLHFNVLQHLIQRLTKIKKPRINATKMVKLNQRKKVENISKLEGR